MSNQCGHGQLGRTCLMCEMQDKNLALLAKLADCQAVIRGRGHAEGCESNWCKHCGLAMHAHTIPISHPLESRPCSESCGHDRTTGEKV